jgi:hypothetical protein
VAKYAMAGCTYTGPWLSCQRLSSRTARSHFHASWCPKGHGNSSENTHLTPTGKPPPLAVRLAKALPFQRAQVAMRDARTVHDDLHTADGAHAQVAMVSSNTARHGRGCATYATAAGGVQGPSGPFSTSLAPSGGLHQTTRSAGST